MVLPCPRAAAAGARSQRQPLSSALFVTSEVIDFDRHGRRGAYDRLQAAARLTRTWGDGYGYLMVATGRADVMVDPVMALWDAAPLPPILEEAGGTFTDWQGNATHRAGEGVATNGLLLKEVLHAISRRLLRQIRGVDRLLSGAEFGTPSASHVDDLANTGFDSRRPANGTSRQLRPAC